MQRKKKSLTLNGGLAKSQSIWYYLVDVGSRIQTSMTKKKMECGKGEIIDALP
jgi:hypothetical protein